MLVISGGKTKSLGSQRQYRKVLENQVKSDLIDS